MRGILNLRLIGYYKIKQGVLQQNLSKYNRFKSADTLCEQFNKIVNTLKRRKKRQRRNTLGCNKVMKGETWQTGKY